MSQNHFSRFLLSISLCCLLFVSGCTEQKTSLTENDLQDLSRHAVSLNTSNRFTLYPLIEDKLADSPNPEFHKSVFEIAMVMDTLAMNYIDQAGGIAENGTMMNPSDSGEKAVQLYQNLNTKQKLSSLVSKARSLAGPADQRLMRATEYVMQQKFLSDAPYFNPERLSQKPLSVLSLELLVLENQLCSLLLKEMSANRDEKQPAKY
ncbi:hypothetical protein H7F15_17480 [Pontibacter sp. Tf4]|uniref:hypothetical protein n=1 Tax=Pontibacter sp. Tf4 TaxID=2761620 RepID=UPI00162ACFFE|nr:hypothetical protein [Pontibacter sp. Tf4]MBB6612837.1 hypothetical protein [Pontibacter sp. Tf4]